MASFSKLAILPPAKVTLVIRKRNALILPPGVSRLAHTSPPPSPPFQPSPALPAPSVSIEQEELEWAFMNDQFIDISSDRSSSGDDIIEDLEERDVDGLPELPPSLRPAGYHNSGTRMQALTMMESGVPHQHITALTKICTSQLYKIRNKAIKRGYNPKVSRLLLDSYVADEHKSGRPPIPLDITAMIEEIVTKNATTRSFSCSHIASQVAT
jgi:hypothetical protein